MEFRKLKSKPESDLRKAQTSAILEGFTQMTPSQTPVPTSESGTPAWTRGDNWSPISC